MANEVRYWGYGSGSVGCLFDNGPHVIEGTKEDAIEAALFIFEADFADTEEENAAIEAELAAARTNLGDCGIHYFDSALRLFFGADYVEIWESDEGPEEEE